MAAKHRPRHKAPKRSRSLSLKRTAVRGRVAAYDVARGIGIILVVIGHSLTMDTYARAFIYTFHIPLFFIISGAVMRPANLQGLRGFAMIRALIHSERKLLTEYLFYSLCFMLYDVVIRVKWLHEFGKRDLMWDVYKTITLCGINVLWFVITLAVAKIITSWLVSKMAGTASRLLTSVAIYLVFAWLGQYAGLHVDETSRSQWLYYPMVAFFEIMTMSAFVLLGQTVRATLPSVLKRWGWAFPTLIIPNVFLCQFAGTTDYHLLNPGFPPLSLALAITGSLAVFGIGELIGKTFVLYRIFKWYSTNSLFVMVTHEYLLLGRFFVAPAVTWLATRYAALPWLPTYMMLLLLLEVPVCMLLRPPSDKLIATTIAIADGWGKPRTARHAKL